MNFDGDRTPYKRTRTHYVTKIRYLEQLSAGNSTEHDFLHFHPGGGVGRNTPGNSWLGCAAPFLKS